MRIPEFGGLLVVVELFRKRFRGEKPPVANNSRSQRARAEI
jgi:hypothetical protein